MANSLFGLKSLGDSEGVRELVMALTPKVEACTEPLKAKEVANSLFGLKSLGELADALIPLDALMHVLEGGYLAGPDQVLLPGAPAALSQK